MLDDSLVTGNAVPVDLLVAMAMADVAELLLDVSVDTSSDPDIPVTSPPVPLLPILVPFAPVPCVKRFLSLSVEELPLLLLLDGEVDDKDDCVLILTSLATEDAKHNVEGVIFEEEDEDATEGDAGEEEEAAVDETGKFDAVTTEVET